VYRAGLRLRQQQRLTAAEAKVEQLQKLYGEAQLEIRVLKCQLEFYKGIAEKQFNIPKSSQSQLRL